MEVFRIKEDTSVNKHPEKINSKHMVKLSVMLIQLGDSKLGQPNLSPPKLVPIRYIDKAYTGFLGLILSCELPKRSHDNHI